MDLDEHKGWVAHRWNADGLSTKIRYDNKKTTQLNFLYKQAKKKKREDEVIQVENDTFEALFHSGAFSEYRSQAATSPPTVCFE